MYSMARLFEELGFEPFPDRYGGSSAFRVIIGPFTIEALESMNKWLRPSFFLSGVVDTGRTLGMIEGELPVEASSREEGLALLGHFLGQYIPEEHKPKWLRDAEGLRDHLPWATPKTLAAASDAAVSDLPIERKLRRNLHKQRSGGTSISIDLFIEEDGSIELSGQDLGTAPEAFVGSDSYEYWVRLKPTALNQLVLALLSTRFSGSAHAVSAFREFCKAHGIQHEYGTWPL